MRCYSSCRIAAALPLAVQLFLLVLFSAAVFTHSARLLNHPNTAGDPSVILDQIESQTLTSSGLKSQESANFIQTQKLMHVCAEEMHPSKSEGEGVHLRIGNLHLLHDVPSGPNPISQNFPSTELVGIEGSTTSIKRSPPPPILHHHHRP
eukprot:Gb_33249 [translate_table: standard]